MLMLDEFFVKYDQGVKLIPPDKTTFKKPSLIRVKEICTNSSLMQVISRLLTSQENAIRLLS